jgi:hypothetical protein
LHFAFCLLLPYPRKLIINNPDESIERLRADEQPEKTQAIQHANKACLTA